MSDKNNADPFKFEDQIDEANWEMLKDHHTRGAVFLVDNSLDLVTVATAVAKDSVELVKTWLNSEKLRSLNEQEIAIWEAMPKEKVIKFLIVQPYVLVQKVLKN